MSVPAYPATKTVHWPNGPVHACDDHARTMTRLAKFLGTHVGVTAAPDGSECANCVNKEKHATTDAGGEG